MVYVIKASGKKEEFNPNKIRGTLFRAGASNKLIDEIVNEVERKVYDGITTREIFDTAMQLLKSQKPEIASIYDLKNAIMNLGPTGFPFERFFAKVLENYGYKTEVGQNVRGRITSHEVDIIARKKYRYMIECKYHNSPGVYTNLKVVLYVYARFLDLSKHFDRPWIATNTKLSQKAVIYAERVNMRITSWNYPGKKSLRELIERKKLYPITILKSIDNNTKMKLTQAGIFLVENLSEHSMGELKVKTKIPESQLKKIIDEARKIRKVKVR
ncbi:restriction endonuclease [Candidatus Pacearchaeota archaeon]|nr:restriction endonuclease [Candidatus Pacearchaeota archaeon]